MSAPTVRPFGTGGALALTPVIVERGPGVLALTLSTPKGNILDTATLGALRAAVAAYGSQRGMRAILFAGRGPHFSLGASVSEHRPESVRGLFAALHGLFLDLLDLSVPCVAAVRGHCLGGAAELVLLCSHVTAAPDATFGFPEVKLGVFAPLASALLPAKVGLTRAERLLLGGEPVDAATAAAIGLVDVVAVDPEAAARRYIDDHLAPRSATALRYAMRALRGASAAQVRQRLAALERLYLDELLATPDAKEGVAAFLEKRPPRWEDAAP